MGKAIILQDSDFSAYNLGVVTRITEQILPNVVKISSATTFRVEKDGEQLTSVSWAISDNTLASLVDNEDGTCVVTPLLYDNSHNVILTATVDGEELTIAFVPALVGTYTWYIDRCTSSPDRGSLANANLANGGWAYMSQDNALLQGKTINRIILVPSQAGVMNLYKATALTGPVTLVASFTITSAQVGVKTMYDFTGFTLGANEFFVIGQANSAGGFKYLSGSSGQNSFYSIVPASPSPSSPVTPGTSAIDLNMSVGYYGTDI